MLDNILGSKVKIKIIRKLVSLENREFNFEELSKSLNLSFGAVHPALRELSDSRIVVVRKMGKSKLYSINKKHLIFNEIKNLFNVETASFLKVAIKFSKTVDKKGIKNILLFGSVARGEASEKSDIDILIIYKNKSFEKENIDAQTQKFLDMHDVEIIPTYLSMKEALKRRKKFDRFIMNVINEGKVLYGDIKWLEK